MPEALINGRVLTNDGWRSDVAVIVEEGRVRALRDSGEVSGGFTRHDLTGRMLLPGFIDCQVNGGGGVLLNDDPCVATLRTIGEAHRQFGTTCFLPTLISDSADKMVAAVEAVNAALAAKVPGVLGIHFEGPFISAERRGAHDPRYPRAPGADEVDIVKGIVGGTTMVTLAPERVPADMLRGLVDAGVVVAIGHSNADYQTAQRAVDAGARGYTHVYNAMSPLTSRAPGVVGAALDGTGTWCGVIVDGHHVASASLRVLLKAKPRGKVFLVTDAMPPVGASTPAFLLGGERIVERDGVCRTANGTLAGSALTMITAVRNTVDLLGVPLDEAVRMASTYPADFLGIAATHGRISDHQRANFTVIDSNLRVTETWVDGKFELTGRAATGPGRHAAASID